MGLSIRIVDESEHLVKEGCVGNVQITGAMIVSRYYEDEQETDKSHTDDGWFRTGDLGFIKDERLTITGRKKDTIIINGRNISNHEIEYSIEELRRCFI